MFFFSSHFLVQNVLIVEVSELLYTLFNSVTVGKQLAEPFPCSIQDIIDTGKTMKTLLQLLKQYNPKMVKVARYSTV
uniref:Uncharacterized protein n=1 Tax=Anguilla anguilla TaxID=7936 RepID=A0A0E9WHG1_ANGAN